MKFVEVAETWQQLELEPSRTAMTKILANLLERSSPHEAKILAYLSLGTLFSPYQDLQFQIAQKGMIDIIAQLVDRTPETIQKHFKQAGDLGLVVQGEWSGKDHGMSLKEVYDELIKIAEISGTGSTEKKAHKLVQLLKNLNALSAKFVVRIVSKTLRLGFSDMTFLDALSWMQTENKSLSKDLESAYNVCADLGLVAYTLKKDGTSGIKKMSIEVGIPIRPAAAERLGSAQEIVQKLGSCVAQPKLDGFRIQVHMKRIDSKIDVHFFSRNMLDMSSMFPELKKIVEKLPVSSVICEGEAIVYDEETETFLPFQQTVKRKRKHDVEQMSVDMPLRLYLFDILYLNGKSLLDLPHTERRVILQDLVKEQNNEQLQIVEEKKITSGHQLEAYFMENIQAGLEGLVVKRPDSVYQPGKRNFNWIKLKREAHGSLLDTIDCVILGYFVGQGKRSKFGIGAFLVGLYDSKKDQFETVAKIGTGMTDHEWKDLKKQCDKIAQKDKPKNVVCAKELYPDVWVEPVLVCTIQADEITLSPLHSAGKTADHVGYALRFPRFVTYRSDKSAVDVTSVTELVHLYHQQKKIKS